MCKSHMGAVAVIADTASTATATTTETEAAAATGAAASIARRKYNEMRSTERIYFWALATSAAQCAKAWPCVGDFMPESL